MEAELLYAKVDQLEASGPLARRRSAMSGAQISTRAYGVQRVWPLRPLQRVCEASGAPSPAPCRRRGPVGAAPDDVLRRVLEASPFHGEGDTKLRVEGRRTSKERVRRLMRTTSRPRSARGTRTGRRRTTGPLDGQEGSGPTVRPSFWHPSTRSYCGSRDADVSNKVQQFFRTEDRQRPASSVSDHSPSRVPCCMSYNARMR